jgi:hypothetical protein
VKQAPLTIPISAFSPIGFTFRLLERDFFGVAGPLMVASTLGHLDLLSLAFDLTESAWSDLVIVAIWLPIGSYCNAGMLRFCLKAARREDHGYRDLWIFDASVLRLIGLELLIYLATGLSVLMVCVGMPKDGAWGAWPAMQHIPDLAPTLGTAGQIALCSSLAVLWAIVGTRTAIAEVLAADERLWPWRALKRSFLLTRGHAMPIVLFGVIIFMIASLSQSVFAAAILPALATPGLVFLTLALRGELAE